MTVEVNPVGMRCGAQHGGLSCAWCYQLPLGAASAPVPALDLGAVLRTLEANPPNKGEGFTLFGGEPLLASLEDLEALWRAGLERYGRNGVQTSGRPIREEHWPLFRKYRVSVSFSIEGPGELNDARWAGTREATREATAHSIACLERCLSESIPTALITTLHRANAAPDRLERLINWLADLAGKGLQSVNLHVLEHDGAYRHLALDHAGNFAALLEIWHARPSRYPSLEIQPFRDMLALLRGEDSWTWKDGTSGGVGCIWTGCDPFTTPAVVGIEPDGGRSLCQRVHKTRTSWGPASPGPLFRQIALRATSQEDGGCKGCRQLITCKGQCPGTAEGGDWRRRSRDCELWKGLLEHFEGVLLGAGVTPVTLRPERPEIERRMAAHWAAGRAVKIAQVLDEIRGGRPGPQPAADHTDHGDHWDAAGVLAGAARERVREDASPTVLGTDPRPRWAQDEGTWCHSQTKAECEAAAPHHHDGHPWNPPAREVASHHHDGGRP